MPRPLTTYRDRGLTLYDFTLAIVLLKEKLTYREIAKMFAVSQTSVENVMKRYQATIGVSNGTL